MPASLRARVLVNCEHREMQARSQPEAAGIGRGIRLGIAAIQAVRPSRNRLTYLARLKKAVRDEGASIGNAQQAAAEPVLRGLQSVLDVIEEVAATVAGGRTG